MIRGFPLLPDGEKRDKMAGNAPIEKKLTNENGSNSFDFAV